MASKDYGPSLHQPVTSNGMGIHPPHPSHHSPHPAYPSPPLMGGAQRSQYDTPPVGYHGLCGGGPVSPQGGSACMSPDIDKKENKPKGRMNFIATSGYGVKKKYKIST